MGRIRRIPNPIILTLLVTLTACLNDIVGDSNGGATNTFPLNRALWLDAENVGLARIHIFEKGTEDFDAANRIEGDASLRRQLPSRAFSSAGASETYTIVAGRNGTILQEKTVTVTGAEAKAGKNLSVTWFDDSQTLVVVVQ